MPQPLLWVIGDSTTLPQQLIYVGKRKVLWLLPVSKYLLVTQELELAAALITPIHHL